MCQMARDLKYYLYVSKKRIIFSLLRIRDRFFRSYYFLGKSFEGLGYVFQRAPIHLIDWIDKLQRELEIIFSTRLVVAVRWAFVNLSLHLSRHVCRFFYILQICAFNSNDTIPH